MSHKDISIKSKLDSIEERLRGQGDQHLDFLAHKEQITRILELVERKNVLVLGHNYMAPLVYSISGEKERGDSLALSRRAAETRKPIILFDGVRFMAETAKILSPEKKVLIADVEAGCSLADPFTADDIRAYRARYPGSPVVTYINSYADVKAESDYCCTSANAIAVVKHAARESGARRVIFFPDSLMARNIQNELRRDGYDLEVVYPGRDDDLFGRCEVHEKFTAEHIRDIRRQFDMPKGASNAAVLVHWECPPEVVAEADYCGSTSDMARYITRRPGLVRVYLATECEMAANLASEFPQVEFVRTCGFFCQHMRRITLDKILRSLEDEVHEVDVPEAIRVKARRAIDRMLGVD
ncbi:MAG: quinolinate synthase NadA [Vicinamibacteria bacterium]|nr:quinolinate synthase NadA [Vicinamibacteria bacterium]